ncbi:MAG: GTPase HflX [Tissierellia bacterium]|nr:GTPase HflX [Tissierellia bacterium]
MEVAKEHKQRAIAVGIWDGNTSFSEESLKELVELIEVAGAEVVATMTQQVHKYSAGTLMGRGKLEELSRAVEDLEADLVVVDQELSGMQMRNISDACDCFVLDRTGMVLDIFALRAKSRAGKLQVLLGQLIYRKNRLIGAKNFSRQSGGIGSRGPGEQKLELDRRHIHQQIRRVEEKLKAMEKVRDTTRKGRDSHGLPKIALIGYTNSGKSSLMNRMLSEGESSGSAVYVEDQVFASLDPDTRLIHYPGGYKVYVTDTVGFISNLPTQLIKAFASTMEEVADADVWIHVLDGSSKRAQLAYDTTRALLREISPVAKPTLLLVNKADQLEQVPLPLEKGRELTHYGSVKYDENFDEFYGALSELLAPFFVEGTFLVPYDAQEVYYALNRLYSLSEVEYRSEGIFFSGRVSRWALEKYREYRVNDVSNH